MFYKIFVLTLITFLPNILFSQVNTFIQEQKDHVLFQVSSPHKINLIETENVTGGAALTLTGENMQLPDKFSQQTINKSFIKYIIQNQLIKNHIQFILKEGKSKFTYYTNTLYDSLYHFQIFIFPENKANRNHLALYLKGVEYHNSNQIKNAISFYRKSIRSKSQNGNAYYKAGQIRLLNKENDKALINFNKAVKFKTDSIKAYFYLAEINKKLNRQPKAQNYAAEYKNARENILKARAKNKVIVVKEKIAKDTSDVNVADSSENTPLKLIIIFLTIAIIIFVTTIIIRKNKNDIEDFDEDEDEYEYEEPVEVADDRFKQVFEQQKEEIIQDDDFNIAEEKISPKPEIEENHAKSLQQELTDEKIKKAKEMELGVGELDLALNIKSKLKNKRKLAGKEEFIIEMYNQGMDKEEIAKELNLNFGEVDLVIGLNKHRLLKDRQ